MKPITITKSIAASPEKVFAVLADVPNFPNSVPSILRVEVLSPGPVGLGTKFKETRKMFGKECTETMEVTAYEPSRRIELGGDSCGMLFRTEFLVTPDTTGSHVDVTMNAEAKTFFTKVMSVLTGWITKGVMKKCVAADLDSVAKHVEAKS